MPVLGELGSRGPPDILAPAGRAREPARQTYQGYESVVRLHLIRDRAGLGATRFHDLRHTCVTLLLDLGTPPHVVREIVGHSAIEVTMTIYAHVPLEEKRKALGKLGKALG